MRSQLLIKHYIKPAQCTRPCGVRIAEPHTLKTPGGICGTGQPPLNGTCIQLYSRYVIGVLASAPKKSVKFFITAVFRSKNGPKSQKRNTNAINTYNFRSDLTILKPRAQQ